MSSLINTYSIVYFSQFNFIVNNYQQIFKMAEKIAGQKLFFKVLEKTFSKQFLSGRNMEETKIVAKILGEKGFGVMAICMAEYLGTKPTQQFYEDNLKIYLNAIDVTKENLNPTYFVAIKFTALIEHDSLIAANDFTLKTEDFFNENFSGEHEKFGKFMTKQEFFEKFP